MTSGATAHLLLRGFVPRIPQTSFKTRELFVHAPIELWIDRPLPVGRLHGQGPRVPPSACPTPCGEAEDQGRHADPGQRQHPREQVETVLRRRRENRLTVLLDEKVLDLALRPPGGDLGLDLALDGFGGIRVRLRERRVADRAHDLVLELIQRRMPLAGRRGRREQQRGHSKNDETRHALLAASCFRKRGRSSSACICPITLPSRSMKKIRGIGRPPQVFKTLRPCSRTIVYVMPYLRTYCFASELKSSVLTPTKAISFPYGREYFSSRFEL